MIRFVDLKTGNTFDGSSPYIFWLDGEQSVNMIYTQPICFISTTPNISVSIEDNDIFSLVDTSKLIDENVQTIYGFNYYGIDKLTHTNNNGQKTKITSLESVGIKHHNYYVHMIYLFAMATTEGEYIADLTIDGGVYQIGGDFYANDDALYINLANAGVEIPEMVQKALYDVNVHEEKRDDITINRKWKELLSNYWDTLANKGSYKSLFNSLKWFEYGDAIRMCEIWKNTNTNQYFSRDIQQMLSDKYSKTLNGFAKTTYIALYHALEKHKTINDKIVWDNELNPTLEKIVSKWSIQDLALKLCMLGNFYETYFMPIHLDLLHSTIEDIVYTSPIKVHFGQASNREDYIYHCDDILCNVKDDTIYRLGEVECYVGKDTIFGAHYNNDNNSLVMVGVQKDVPKISYNANSENELKDYIFQLYKEIGAIVDFKIELPHETNIKRETLVFKTWDGERWIYKSITEQRWLNNKLEFSVLCPIEGDYEIRLLLECTNNKSYTKRVKFKVLNTEHTKIEIYKICNYGTPFKYMLEQQGHINSYNLKGSRTIQDINVYKQYIPSYIGQPYVDGQWVHKGVCLNHLLIYNDVSVQTNSYLQSNYFMMIRNIANTTKKYLICISKQYGFIPDKTQLLSVDKIYRDDYIFVPEFHKLVPLVDVDDELNINNYKVTDMDALCVIPELSYGKNIEEYEWSFVNTSRPDLEPINLSNIKEPFIANTEKAVLPNGYYTIVFRYRLIGEDKINTVTLDSAFIKV